MLLQFKDGTSAECNVLGSVEVDGMRYAVFLSPKQNMSTYINMRKRRRITDYIRLQIKPSSEKSALI